MALLGCDHTVHRVGFATLRPCVLWKHVASFPGAVLFVWLGGEDEKDGLNEIGSVNAKLFELDVTWLPNLVLGVSADKF